MVKECLLNVISVVIQLAVKRRMRTDKGSRCLRGGSQGCELFGLENGMDVDGRRRDPLRESLYSSALEVPSQEPLTRLAPLLSRVLLVVSIYDKH